MTYEIIDDDQLPIKAAFSNLMRRIFNYYESVKAPGTNKMENKLNKREMFVSSLNKITLIQFPIVQDLVS